MSEYKTKYLSHSGFKPMSIGCYAFIVFIIFTTQLSFPNGELRRGRIFNMKHPENFKQ